MTEPKPLSDERPYGLYGFPNVPVRKEPDPIADLTVDQIRELAKRLGDDSSELGSIKATLAVNCKECRRLAEFGCTYDEKKSAHTNLFTVLEKLCNLIDERDATIRRRGELIAWLVSGDAVVVRGDGGICIHTKSAAEIGREYATEVHAIVAGLEQD